VPCSTSNLGAGFDCIGLAFSRYLTVRYEATSSPLRLTRGGTLSQLTEPTESDAVVIGLRSVLGAAPSLSGLLTLDSDIPVGRGLGSSAAATVAGIVLGYVLRASASPPPGLLEISPSSRMYALASASNIEGHPDNAAPSLFGGLVAVAHGDSAVLNAFRLPLSPSIGFVFAAPDAVVSTAAARAALPSSVPFGVATAGIGRVAALVRGLESADADLLAIGLTDELHVPHRMPLIPGASEAFAAARAAGAWGATISGSGSGLIALCPLSVRAEVASAMSSALATPRGPGVGIEMEPDTDGVVVMVYS
jgi:homoserine kinase